MRLFRKPSPSLSDDTWAWLLEEHPIFNGLSADELASLRDMTGRFLHQKTFEGADGLELQDHMRLTISAQACLPVLHLGLDWYSNWKTIVVVPDIFVEEHSEIDKAGVAHEWKEDSSGESWDEGPVLLSWKDVEESGWGDGYNVVIHEAAHRLDLLDGEMNGRPALHDGMDPKEWHEVFSKAYEHLKGAAKKKGGRGGRKRGRRRIDEYAAESDSEFFAVTSEYFFEKPKVLAAEYPDVYRLLAEFYRQEPAGRVAPDRKRWQSQGEDE